MMETRLIELPGLTLAELRETMLSWQQPAFRAEQIYTWIYHRFVSDFAEMRNLPLAFRTLLAERSTLGVLEVVKLSQAEDQQSDKVLFRADDGQTFESVLMRYTERNTVCLSSQIGCSLGCALCATGQSGFVRDLRPAEMIAQLLHFGRILNQEGAHITNVVLMGMGEPLLNYDAVWHMLQIANDTAGLGLGARRFTISTAGVIPGIDRLAGEGSSVGLAISLHAPDDDLRNELVPLNRRYPLAQLVAAAKRFSESTGRRVTWEYALAAGVNDRPEQAKRTAALLAGMHFHVNLISLNPTPGCTYKPSPMEKILAFQEVLRRARIRTTIRLRRGDDITAGCGQLRGAEMDDDDDEE